MYIELPFTVLNVTSTDKSEGNIYSISNQNYSNSSLSYFWQKMQQKCSKVQQKCSKILGEVTTKTAPTNHRQKR